MGLIELTKQEESWHHQFVQKYLAMPIEDRAALIQRFATHTYNSMRIRQTKEMTEKNPALIDLIKSLELI